MYALRRTKTDVVPEKKKKERRGTELPVQAPMPAMSDIKKKKKKDVRRSSTVEAPSAPKGKQPKERRRTDIDLMKEMDPHAIIGMLEAYGGTDADRERAVEYLQSLKKTSENSSYPEKAARKARRRRNSVAASQRPSLEECKGDWASVSITQLLARD